MSECWTLDKVISKDGQEVSRFESVWFLSPEGESGDYLIEDNEVYITGAWNRKGTLLKVSERGEFTVLFWNDKRIALNNDGANLYLSKK